MSFAGGGAQSGEEVEEWLRIGLERKEGRRRRGSCELTDYLWLLAGYSPRSVCQSNNIHV